MQCLTSHTVPQNELLSVIETIVSSVKASSDVVKCFQGSEAQGFIDVMDEACHRQIQSPSFWFVDLYSDLLLPFDMH